MRRAWISSAVWISVAIAFGVWIWTRLGRDAALSYYTAYFLEKSLSIDNLAVFALIFAQTGIVGPLQRKVLMWGVVGALAMRAALIAVGLYILQKFQWVVYPFAALLLYAAVQMMRSNTQRRLWVDTTCTLCRSWVAKFIPITPEHHHDHFTVRLDGRRYATPLLVALVGIESVDLVFAIDSVPAVFAVTREPFLVYTSNVFALLGLRSLYAVVGNVFERYPYFRFALTAMLVFVAIKLGASAFIHIPAGVSLGVIASIIALAAAATRWLPEPRLRRRWSRHVPIAIRSGALSRPTPDVPNAGRSATHGRTFACAGPAATSVVAKARKTSTRRRIFENPAIRSSSHSSPASIGSGVTSTMQSSRTTLPSAADRALSTCWSVARVQLSGDRRIS